MKRADTPYLSRYKIMWILVMFDIPVDTKARVKAATHFRKFLLDTGFEMCQYSIYTRFCNGREQFDSYVRKISQNLPQSGKIQILHFTDKQYESIISFSGHARERQNQKPNQLVLF